MINMEFTQALVAIKTMKKIVQDRCAIPVMSHVTVTRDSFGRAVFTGSDLESWLSMTVEGSHVDSGTPEFTVSRADLERVLTGGDKGKLICMTVTPGSNRDGHVAVSHDGVTADLDILPIEDFPSTPDVTVAVHVPLSYNTARGMMSYCAGAMSSEETRYYLKGVYLHQYQDTGKLACVATDGHRLNLAETSAIYDGDGVIMRDDAVKLALHLMGKADGTVQLRLPQDGAMQIELNGEGWTLVTRRVDGTFPVYSRVLPRDTKGKGTLSCGAVAKAAARVARITSKTGAAVLDIGAGVIRHNGTGCGVKGLSIDLGHMFPSGALEPVGVNPVYLDSAMSQMEEFSDTCTVYVTDASTPIRVHPRTLPSWAENMTSVIMPMRY